MGLLNRLLSLVAIVCAGVAYTNTTVYLGSTFVAFLHLLALATVVGTGNWTTFVFGIVAFKTLPRASFGLLQSKLFPAYFKVLTGSIAVGLVTAPKLGDTTLLHVLVVALLCTLANLLWIEPVTTRIMFDRHRIEKEAGSHDEALHKPEHKALSKKFGMYHGLSSLANLVALACAHVWLWHVASKIRLS